MLLAHLVDQAVEKAGGAPAGGVLGHARKDRAGARQPRA